jgi:Tol biopolymer transport system component
VAAGYYLVKFSNVIPGLHPASTPFVDSTIVFGAAKSDPTGALTIYSYAKDGKVTDLLANSSFTDTLNPSLSPDLKKIAFMGVHNGKQEIVVMGIDGSGAKTVSQLFGPKTKPSWSPDGSKILYSLSMQGAGVAEIDLVNNTDKVIPVGTDTIQAPSWLPDGSGFIYVALNVDQAAGKVLTHLKIYKNGVSQEVKLTVNKGTPIDDLSSPVVSPNGKRVAFVRSSDSRIYLADLDGTNLKLLTSSGSSIFSCPSWSSDSSFVLATESTNDSKDYISKVDVSSGAVTRSGLSGYSKINCPKVARY